jgi:hypothetical protein
VTPWRSTVPTSPARSPDSMTERYISKGILAAQRDLARRRAAELPARGRAAHRSHRQVVTFRTRFGTSAIRRSAENDFAGTLEATTIGAQTDLNL